jgi:hypothetical protein
LQAMDEFFAALKLKYPNLLYLHDEDLRQLVNNGGYGTVGGQVQVNVTRKTFIKAVAASRRV